MKAWIAAIGLLAASLAAAAPASGDVAAEDVLLAGIVRRGFEEPERALADLSRQWPAHAQPGQPREAAWLLARGRLLLVTGQMAAAEDVAVRLVSAPGDGPDRSWLLRALIQERAGKPAGVLAERALIGLHKTCPAGEEARAVAELGCDFRMAWEALRITHREQYGQGAFVDAEAGMRRALALAKAGGDRYLVAFSHGLLAVVLQTQEKLDAAHAEVRAGLAEAQGDLAVDARLRAFAAILERRSGNVAGARAQLEAALRLADEAAAPHLAAQLRPNLVDAYMHLGLTREALAVGQQAMPVLQRFGDRTALHGLHHNLAIAHIKLGQFEAARQDLARKEQMGNDPADLVRRSRELRELGDAWADAKQYKEALTAFHAERELNARSNERNRAAALEELRRKYDSAAKQRDLDLLARDGQLKDQQLENHRLARQVGFAVGALLLLSVALIGVTLLRMRRAQVRLTANQHLLRAQSERDPLTDLSNRRHFLAVMDALARERGGDGFEGALMMIDIDHFKHVNDEHGHAAGDAVIVEVGRRIRAAVRDTELVVRWGGEEFLVFSPDLGGRELAQMAERMLRSIAGTPVQTPDGPLRITASIGFARFPMGGVDTHGAALRLHWEQAVNWADMVLYKAKAEGRNRAIGIATVEAVDADTLAAILQDFDAACRHGQVRLSVMTGPA